MEEEKDVSPFEEQGKVPENAVEQNQQPQEINQPIENVEISAKQDQNSIESERSVDVFEILKISWNTFKINAKFLLTLSLIYFGIRFAEGIVQKMVAKDSWSFMLATVIIAAFNILIAIGVIQIFLKISRGREADYGEIIDGGKYFWKFIGGSILYGLIVLAGYLLLIIPGIIWQYKYAMFSYLIIDKDMSPIDALKESGRIMYGFKWKLFFLQLLMFVVAIVGLLLLGIGLLAAIPVMTLMQVIFYRIVAGEKVSA